MLSRVSTELLVGVVLFILSVVSDWYVNVATPILKVPFQSLASLKRLSDVSTAPIALLASLAVIPESKVPFHFLASLRRLSVVSTRLVVLSST